MTIETYCKRTVYDLELCHSARMRTTRLHQRKPFNDGDSPTTELMFVSRHFQSSQHGYHEQSRRPSSFGSLSFLGTMKPNADDAARPAGAASLAPAASVSFASAAAAAASAAAAAAAASHQAASVTDRRSPAEQTSQLPPTPSCRALKRFLDGERL